MRPSEEVTQMEGVITRVAVFGNGLDSAELEVRFVPLDGSPANLLRVGAGTDPRAFSGMSTFALWAYQSGEIVTVEVTPSQAVGIDSPQLVLIQLRQKPDPR